MNVMTPHWIEIGTLDDIPRRGARCVRNGPVTIAVFRTDDDKVFALEDRCPHRQGPLSQGIVHDGCVQDFPMLDSVPSTTGTLAVFSQQTLFWRIVRRDIKPHIVEMRRQPS